MRLFILAALLFSLNANASVEKEVCDTAQSLIDDGYCDEAADRLLTLNARESELERPQRVHLLLLEAQACSHGIQSPFEIMERLNMVKSMYRFNEEEKQKIEKIERDLEGKEGFVFRSWYYLLLISVFVLGLLMTHKRLRIK